MKNLETDGVGTVMAKVEFEGEIYTFMYYADKNDEWHFLYENGKKPSCLEFEYLFMCYGVNVIEKMKVA